MTPRRLLVPFLLAAFNCGGATAMAQDRTVTPPVLQHLAAPAGAQPLTLADAVNATLRRNTSVRLLREAIRTADGVRRFAAGSFDSQLVVAPSLTLDRHHLLPALTEREIGKRQFIGAVANDFAAVADQFHAAQELPAAAAPRCPSGLRTGTTLDPSFQTVDRLDAAEVSQLGVGSDVRFNAATDLGTAGPIQVVIGGVTQYDFSEICRMDLNQLAPAGLLRIAWSAVNQSGGLGIQGTLTSIDQMSRQSPAILEQIARTVAVRASLALDRLGPVPTEQQQRAASVNLTAGKLLRSGVTLSGQFGVQSGEQLYTGKPLDPAFGGFDVPPLFQSSTSISAVFPLGKGRGRTSVEGPLRAAASVVAATEEELRHGISEAVFQTVVSYVNLVAAQARLDLLRASADRQQQIVQVTTLRVAGGDATRADESRARARAALVNSAVSDGQAAVTAARAALAETIGLDVVDDDRTLSAADTLATSPPAWDLDELLRTAPMARRDLRALEFRRDAAGALAESARVDVRPGATLSVVAGLSALRDSPFFRYYPDEQAPIVSELRTIPPPGPSPVRFDSLTGVARALAAPWQPSIQVHVTIQLPFGNNSARGRFVQAQSSLRTATVSERDGARMIGQHVVEAREALRLRRDALERAERAVAASASALRATAARYQAGELTLIDMLLTEQTLTDHELARVDQRQRFFSTMARLRFEAGALVDFVNGATPPDAVRFDPSPFVQP